MSLDIYKLFDQTSRDTFGLVYNGTKFNYNDMAEKISRFSQNLAQIKQDWSDCKIYLDIKNKYLFFVTLFGCMKLNAKCVLIPIEIKPSDYMDDKAAFISDNKHLDKGIFINEDCSLAAGSDFTPNQVEQKSNQPAIYLYTSGSTGKSKLIPKSSTNLLTEVHALKDILKMQSHFKCFFTPPIYHIYGLLMDILLPVYCGCTIYLDDCFSPTTIADYVYDNNIDYFVSTPSYYRMFKESGLIGKFAKVTQFTSSSAPLDSDISKAFLEAGLRIQEVYGSTETGGIAYRVGAISPEWQLFPYVSVKNTTATDDIYEFLIDSATISVEYGPEGYNTNDLVKFSDNDYTKFQLVGRNTRFVKISGKRLDLNYVISKINEYFSSFDMSTNSDNMYVGVTADEKIYVLYNGTFPEAASAMKENLKKLLPGYGVPRYFISSPIPRNSMSKIDKVQIDKIVSEHIKTLK